MERRFSISSVKMPRREASSDPNSRHDSHQGSGVCYLSITKDRKAAPPFCGWNCKLLPKFESRSAEWTQTSLIPSNLSPVLGALNTGLSL
jgi:hypothetical protein